jgi:hypothetical protein
MMTIPKYAKELFNRVKLDVQGLANGSSSFTAEKICDHFNGYTLLSAVMAASDALHVRTTKGKQYGVVIEVDPEAHKAVVRLARGAKLEEHLESDYILPKSGTPGYMYYLRYMRKEGLMRGPDEPTRREPRPRTPPRSRWDAEAARLLVGRRIVSAYYMTDADADAFGWYERGLVLKLDDGTELLVFGDDEGNGPGALAWTDDSGREGMLPVLRRGD